MSNVLNKRCKMRAAMSDEKFEIVTKKGDVSAVC